MNKKIQDYLDIIDKLDNPDYNYIGKIFIRIGIAISSKKPDEYHYKGNIFLFLKFFFSNS